MSVNYTEMYLVRIMLSIGKKNSCDTVSDAIAFNVINPISSTALEVISAIDHITEELKKIGIVSIEDDKFFIVDMKIDDLLDTLEERYIKADYDFALKNVLNRLSIEDCGNISEHWAKDNFTIMINDGFSELQKKYDLTMEEYSLLFKQWTF